MGNLPNPFHCRESPLSARLISVRIRSRPRLLATLLDRLCQLVLGNWTAHCVGRFAWSAQLERRVGVPCAFCPPM